MDLVLEEKLDNFEDLISSFEKRATEIATPVNIEVMRKALKSLTNQYRIAKWWIDDMDARINALEKQIGQPEKKEDEIVATFTWEPTYDTGLYELINPSIISEIKTAKPFSFTVGEHDQTSLMVQVTEINHSLVRFLFGNTKECLLKGIYDDAEMTCDTDEFLEYYKYMEDQ